MRHERRDTKANGTSGHDGTSEAGHGTGHPPSYAGGAGGMSRPPSMSGVCPVSRVPYHGNERERI